MQEACREVRREGTAVRLIMSSGASYGRTFYEGGFRTRLSSQPLGGLIVIATRTGSAQ